MTEQESARTELLAVINGLLGEVERNRVEKSMPEVINALLATKEYLVAEEQQEQKAQRLRSKPRGPVPLDQWLNQELWRLVSNTCAAYTVHQYCVLQYLASELVGQAWKTGKLEGLTEVDAVPWSSSEEQGKTVYHGITAPVVGRPRPAKRAHKRARKGR